MSGLRDLTPKLLLASASTVIAFVLLAAAGEVFVRYRERHRTTVPGTISMLYYQHRRLPHALVRKTDYFGWIHINSYGFRGPEISAKKPAGTLRIMAVGASSTFDTQVTADDRTWPARLEYWINELSGSDRIEVVNAGVPGYQIEDNVIRLQTELHRFQPDIAILYQAHNDISCGLRGERLDQGDTERPDELPIVTPWGRWLQHNSLLYNKLVARLRWIGVRRDRLGHQDSRVASRSSHDDLKCGPEQFERDISLFLQACQSLGFQGVLAEVVHISGVGTLSESDTALRNLWHHVRPYAEPDSGLVLYARYGQVARSAAERHSAVFIETGRFGLRGPHWYADPMHFNDRGADRMGRAMAEALLASGVVAF